MKRDLPTEFTMCCEPEYDRQAVQEKLKFLRLTLLLLVFRAGLKLMTGWLLSTTACPDLNAPTASSEEERWCVFEKLLNACIQHTCFCNS